MTPKQAFLDTLAYSEGTDHPSQKSLNHGYDVIVGGQLFSDYSKHPKVLVPLPRLGIKSTAAGRYQILWKNWVHYSELLKLKDFGPASQDAIAWQMIKECRATDDVLAGRFEVAVEKIRRIWASLPGAGYGQHEHTMRRLRAFYDKRLAS